MATYNKLTIRETDKISFRIRVSRTGYEKNQYWTHGYIDLLINEHPARTEFILIPNNIIRKLTLNSNINFLTDAKRKEN